VKRAAVKRHETLEARQVILKSIESSRLKTEHSAKIAQFKENGILLLTGAKLSIDRLESSSEDEFSGCDVELLGN